MTLPGAGSRLGDRVELVQAVHRGHGAELWRAVDPTTGTALACKWAPLDDPARVAHVEREISFLDALDHPHVVTVTDQGRSDSVAYFTMAWLPEDLGRLRGQQLRAILDVAIALASALAHLHRRGIVHRDLKPANIRLAGSTPLLSDFSIAARVSEGIYTNGGGTPGRRSPNQESGGPPEPADDVYAYGVLLHELLTGIPPSSAPPSGESPSDPSTLSRRALPQLPDGLASLLGALLSPDTNRRPDAATVLGQLETLASTVASAPARPAAGATVANSGPAATGLRLTPPPRTPPSGPGGEVPSTVQPATFRPRRPRDEAGDRRRLAKVLTAVGIGGLLLVGGFVFAVLPNWVSPVPSPPSTSDDAATTTLPATTHPATAPPPVEAAPDRHSTGDARADAETALGALLAQQHRLDDLAVERWAMTELQAARATIQAADQQLQDGDGTAAGRLYAQAAQQLAAIEARAPTVVAEAVTEGQAALSADNPKAATAAFELALAIDPDNQPAAHGLERAAAYGPVSAHVAAATSLERDGQLQAALERYQAALALDRETGAAQQGAARVRERLRQAAFTAAMSAGHDALARADFAAARAAFVRARSLDPGSAAARDGLDQAEASATLAAIEDHRTAAAELEDDERWNEAMARYAAALTLDPTLDFADRGRRRAEARAELWRALEFHRTHAERFAAVAVLDEVEQLLDRAATVTPAGPRHRRQIEELRALVAAAARPVPVQLLSDDKTDITIHRVGSQGRFKERTLALRPGRYVVVGSRQGYRDVREELTVPADRAPEPIHIACQEPI